MGKTRKNRVLAVLGASGALVMVLSGAGTVALAQPAPTLPKLCPAIEALVGDGVLQVPASGVRCSASVPAVRAR